MNFEFHNPTHLILAGALARLGEAVSKHGAKALIVTGGGSVKRSGTFDRAVASLKAAGVAYVECDGVEPNPRITTVVRAQIARCVDTTSHYGIPRTHLDGNRFAGQWRGVYLRSSSAQLLRPGQLSHRV